jgi:hypothetical protein
MIDIHPLVNPLLLGGYLSALNLLLASSAFFSPKTKQRGVLSDAAAAVVVMLLLWCRCICARCARCGVTWSRCCQGPPLHRLPVCPSPWWWACLVLAR